MVMRYLIKLSYNGLGFCGWQRQPNAPSVQETIGNALSTLLRCDTKITGAGRTDTGVSAKNYIAHFDAAPQLDLRLLACKLNAILPPSIVIHSIEITHKTFNARFDASLREYTYYLHRVKDPFLSDYSYLFAYPDVDFGLMNTAAEYLIGRHDFRCFEKTGSDAKTSICSVSEARWHPYSPSLSAWDMMPEGETGYNSARYWYFRITSDRFLRNMVRAVVGTLLEVGRGKRSIENFKSLICEEADECEETDAGKTSSPLSAKTRCSSGESAPGNALFLTRVEY